MKAPGSDTTPILFKYFPDLKDRIGWIKLKESSAPVHPLKNLGYPGLWIKRNDLISSLYGGNKISRLEFILGDVLKKGKKDVITMGGIGSNHCLATAIFCKTLNISCSFSLYDQPVTTQVKENLLLFHKYKAKLTYSKTYLKFGLDWYIAQRMRHSGSYFITGGGSSPIGILGAVNEALELKQQIDEGILPEPRYIFYPTASNGGMAGLMLGLLLSGLKTTVIGVRVGLDKIGPMEFNTRNTVKKAMLATYNLLKKNSPNIPAIDMTDPQIIDGYFGNGYGYPTEKGQKALEILKSKENISLDPVYTAKACAALLDHIKNHASSTSPILYWHTYNSIDLSQEAAGVDYRELPEELHPIFLQESFHI